MILAGCGEFGDRIVAIVTTEDERVRAAAAGENVVVALAINDVMVVGALNRLRRAGPTLRLDKSDAACACPADLMSPKNPGVLTRTTDIQD